MPRITFHEFRARCEKRLELEEGERQALDRALYEASEKGIPDKITEYLIKGASANHGDPKTGKSPMTVVTTIDVALKLLEGGGSLTTRDGKGQLPLVAAIQNGHLEVAQTFLATIMVGKPLDSLETKARVAAIKQSLGKDFREVKGAGLLAYEQGFRAMFTWVTTYIEGQKEPSHAKLCKLLRKSRRPSLTKGHRSPRIKPEAPQL